MADKAISELISAEQITATDMFVLEQNGTAKKLTGQVLLNWLTAAADGHGGIQSIAKTGTSGLRDTYRITMADTTVFDFVVSNGRGIIGISKTSTDGLVDTYTIQFNDGTSDTFSVTNGKQGDTGAASYVWIKWASQEPTENSHSFGDLPDSWMGIYSGTSETAPSDWTQYQWFEIKGKQGDTGAAATLISYVAEYMVSNSGSVIPSGSWTASIPNVAQGKYLWTRITQKFNTGDPVIYYSVSRMGVDGLGSVVSVNNVSPDTDGNVQLTPESIGALSTAGGTMAGAIEMGGNKVTGLGTPTAEGDAVSLGYANGAYAPAGFGLGSNTVSAADPDTIAKTGFYHISLEEPSTGYTGNFYCHHINYNADHAAQIAFGMKNSTGILDGTVKKRYKAAGVWSEWEYVNPPMVPGVEYRTPERHNGKPVYVVMVDCGTAVNEKNTSLSTVLNAYETIRFAGTIGGDPMPYIMGDLPNANSAWLTIGKGGSAKFVKTYCGTNMAGRQVYATVWYTKE